MNVANGFYLPLLRSRQIPTVVNVDGVEWVRDKWNALGKKVFRTGAAATARWADEIVSDSHEIERIWLSEFERSSHFIPYGGEPVEAAPDLEAVMSIGLTPGDYVLIVARLVPENNVDVMLSGAIKSGLTTVVVGSGGGSQVEAGLRNQAAGCPNVRFLGHVSDQVLLSSLWKYCAAYLHGHSVGGTNPALVQAMGLGAPVLAYDTLYNREVLGSSQCLVALEPTAIATRVAELVSSSQLRDDMSRQAKQRVGDIYNWPNVCKAYERVLLQLVKKNEDD
jgi:glycosyltransferase involved in cell wall biosynthesis